MQAGFDPSDGHAHLERMDGSQVGRAGVGDGFEALLERVEVLSLLLGHPLDDLGLIPDLRREGPRAASATNRDGAWAEDGDSRSRS